jgi:hypothetical protein
MGNHLRSFIHGTRTWITHPIPLRVSSVTPRFQDGDGNLIGGERYILDKLVYMLLKIIVETFWFLMKYQGKISTVTSPFGTYFSEINS